MSSKPFHIVVGALLIGAAAASAVFFRIEHEQLERRLARQRESTAHSRRLTEENRSLQELVATTDGDSASAAVKLHADLEAARREAAELERHAREQRLQITAQAARDAEALANNRDPRAGLTRLEYFQDRGQATPGAAFETLVWAALRGDEAAMVKVGAMSSAVRADAQALIARLPPEARGQWTPQKLAVLWFTGALTELPALQITGESREDGENAIVTFRTPRGEDEKVKLKLSPDGWRVAVPSNAIKVLEKKLAAAATSP
jgi:hypothetical protein